MRVILLGGIRVISDESDDDDDDDSLPDIDDPDSNIDNDNDTKKTLMKVPDNIRPRQHGRKR